MIDDKHSKEGKGRPQEKRGLFQNGREVVNTAGRRSKPVEREADRRTEGEGLMQQGLREKVWGGKASKIPVK